MSAALGYGSSGLIQSRHVFTGAMKYTIHHGKSKVTCLESIQAVDVVITTYHTVSGEWKSNNSSSSMLFSVQWKRIVLDEGMNLKKTFPV